MIPATTERVTLYTPPQLNEELRRRIQENVAQTAQATPAAIERRLQELDHEWDLDRYMETLIAVVSLTGIALAAMSPWWLLLPAVMAGFLLSHGLFGWCPLLGVFRGWGVRTAPEIAQERYALKALRGDFNTVNVQTPDDREDIARFEGEGGMAYDTAVPEIADPHTVEEVLHAVQK